MASFIVEITQRVAIDIDEGRFTQERMQEFNACIADYGTGPDALETHAIHIANLHVVNLVDCSRENIVEGYGWMMEAGITVEMLDGETNAEIVQRKAGA